MSAAKAGARRVANRGVGMRRVWAVCKLLRGVAHVLHGWWWVRVRFAHVPASAQQAYVQAWAQRLLQLWGIELRSLGAPAHTGGVLLVSNHLSWLDIVVMHASRYCRFVAKSEVRGWPVVGALATGAGSLYIARSRGKDARRVVGDMACALQAGHVLAVFPEGTTSDGRVVLPFHANLLQAAIDTDAPVQPLALQFFDAATGHASGVPCYVGEDALWQSVWRTLCAPPLVAVVHWGTAQTAQGRQRRPWAHDLHRTVVALKASAAQQVAAGGVL